MTIEVSRKRREGPRRAILKATVELLEEVGYRDATIEAIARRAGVGKQTIYRWWGGSRPALVLEAFLGATDDRFVPADTGTIRNDLIAILAPVFSLNANRMRGTALANRTLMAEAQLDEAVRDEVLTLHRSWWGPMIEAVQRGIDRGELDDKTDPMLLVELLLGASWYRLLLGYDALRPQEATALVDVVLAGAAHQRLQAR